MLFEHLLALQSTSHFYLPRQAFWGKRQTRAGKNEVCEHWRLFIISTFSLPLHSLYLAERIGENNPLTGRFPFVTWRMSGEFHSQSSLARSDTRFLLELLEGWSPSRFFSLLLLMKWKHLGRKGWTLYKTSLVLVGLERSRENDSLNVIPCVRWWNVFSQCQARGCRLNIKSGKTLCVSLHILCVCVCVFLTKIQQHTY